MKILFFTTILVVLATVLPDEVTAVNRIVCYYGSWATYRPGNGKFNVANIDPHLCTHVIYAFVGLNDDGTLRVQDPADIQKFANLKSHNPHLKTLVAVGGANEPSSRFSRVARDPSLRARFVQEVVNFVSQHHLDGFDVDWEYPNKNGGAGDDVANFIHLLAALQAQFVRRKWILSVAVGATEEAIKSSYNVVAISKAVNFINLMAYDLHGPWDHVTGQNAPLASHDQLNVQACVAAWIKHGADRSKINLGIGAYGHSFTLDNPGNHGVGAAASNPGSQGPYTQQPGMLGYNEIAEYLRKPSSWKVYFDKQQGVPYMVRGNQWVGYDNPVSVTLKMQYANKMKLGGAMVWSIDTDDFHGVSGQKFALVQTIRKHMKK